ncbi:unnamed protein product, partial [Pocillopora meandrina]
LFWQVFWHSCGSFIVLNNSLCSLCSVCLDLSWLKSLICLINRHASGLQQGLKKFLESSCSLTQDLVRPKKKTQGDASHQTRSSSAAISWMGLGERDQVFPWFTLFTLLTLKPEGLNICQISLVYCCSQVSSCRT